jgi:transposase
MQTKRDNRQQRMVLLPPLEEYIPSDHRLKRLNRVLDLSFVHEAVRERYCQNNGRPSIDPEVVMRLFLLQAIEHIVEVRELMRQVEVNLAYRWFIGYELDEKLPDHSTLSKALDRFGDGVFNELFSRSIAQCQKSDLIEGKVLHVDATTIRADIDKNKVEQAESSDKDARYGRFADGTIQPGYKQQTVVDDQHRVVVGLEVFAANRAEGVDAVRIVDAVREEVGLCPEVVCADGAYGSGANRAAFEERGMRLVSPPPQAVTYTGSDYFTVEAFAYQEREDVFVCPAGKTLAYVGGVKARPHQRCYRAGKKVCGQCSLKGRCTQAPRRQLKVGVHHAALIRLRADSKREDFQQLYRTRAPGIEGVFAEAKQRHGLRRAWRRGLTKMRIQCLLIAAVINFKRLITLLTSNSASVRADYALIRLLWTLFTVIEWLLPPITTRQPKHPQNAFTSA